MPSFKLFAPVKIGDEMVETWKNNHVLRAGSRCGAWEIGGLVRTFTSKIECLRGFEIRDRLGGLYYCGRNIFNLTCCSKRSPSSPRYMSGYAIVHRKSRPTAQQCTHLHCKDVTFSAHQPASNYLAAYSHYFSPAETRLLVVCNRYSQLPDDRATSVIP